MTANLKDHFRSVVVATGAVAQIAGGAIPFAAGWGHNVASRSNETVSLLTPAGYAFSIWSVIFAGCLVFAVYHALRPAHAPLRRIGWLAAAVFWLNAAWELYVPVQGFDLGSLLIIQVIWGLLLVIVLTATAQIEAGLWDRVFRAPLFLLAGWLNAAAFVNLLVTANLLEIAWLGAGTVAPALAVLAAALVAALVVVALTRSPSYLAAVSWGAYGIHVANAAGGDPVIAQAALIAAGAGVPVLLIAWAQWARKSRSA